ncbi:MAG: tyrosine-type recombinase/integrase [Planctomycetia bacterium]|nr:tyrosine-type recombinase/integrase [Planctomycetia bacterium]
MKAWVYQDAKQVKKYGVVQASWYVGWLDPAGKRRCQSCGPGATGQKNADKLKRKIEAELLTGTYHLNSKKTWSEFRAEYEDKVLPGLAVRSREEIRAALGHFERISKPVRMAAIKTNTIDSFIAKRRQEPGKKKGDRVSPATVNKDLRHLRAALRKAKRWGYVVEVPAFDMEREPGKLPTYTTPEDFAKIYEACGHATRPAGMPYPAVEWWRALIVTAYMTGWRIGSLLALRRDDVDLDKATAITWHKDNKGKRDQKVTLHPVVVEHLKRLPSFEVFIFSWDGDKNDLYDEFTRIQQKAGVHLPCHGEHEHTPACHVYGFHDLRRAFATMNADQLTPDALQALMQHRSYSTTQRYINLARQMDEAVKVLHVPDVLKAKKA